MAVLLLLVLAAVDLHPREVEIIDLPFLPLDRRLPHDLGQPLALQLHLLLEDPDLLLELLLPRLKSDDLVVVEPVPAENLVVEPLRLLALVAAHVLNDLLAGQVHRAVQAVDQSNGCLLLLLLQLLLRLQLLPHWRYSFIPAHRRHLALFHRQVLLLETQSSKHWLLIRRQGWLRLELIISLPFSILSALKSHHYLPECLYFIEQFGLGVGDDVGDDLLEVDFVLLVKHLDECVLHFEVLIEQLLAEGLALVDGVLVGLEDTRPHPAH